MRRSVWRTALALGVLTGLAAAPSVAQTVRPPAPELATPGDAAVSARPRAPGAGDATADASGAFAGGQASTLPDFTHRSARLADVAREPLALRIAALDVDAPVSAAGVAAGGQLDVPASPDAVVWYGAGSVPGAAGSAVLAGHVDYNGRRGVFFDLARLRSGDLIEVDLDDGTTHAFEVRRVERHAKDALPTAKLFTRNGSPVLTLITCGGDFDRSTGHYTDNTVVQAALTT